MSITLKKLLGRVLSVTAVGGASIALAGCSLLGGGAGVVEGEGEQTDVFTIKVGDCLNDGGAEGEVTSVPTISCDEPHDSEAYLSHMVPDGEFPGQEAVFEEAEAACLAEFESYVGNVYEESMVGFSYFYPTESSWATGDREVLCLLREFDEAGNEIQTTGSLKGSGK